MALQAMRGAGIGDKGHQVAKIAGVTYRMIDALVGEEPGNNEKAYPQIPQHIIFPVKW